MVITMLIMAWRRFSAPACSPNKRPIPSQRAWRSAACRGQCVRRREPQGHFDVIALGHPFLAPTAKGVYSHSTFNEHSLLHRRITTGHVPFERGHLLPQLTRCAAAVVKVGERGISRSTARANAFRPPTRLACGHLLDSLRS